MNDPWDLKIEIFAAPLRHQNSKVNRLAWRRMRLKGAA
jgi:hypothetical protein